MAVKPRYDCSFYPALYMHCASYSLNLAVSDGCDQPLIRNPVATIKQIYNFFGKILARSANMFHFC